MASAVSWSAPERKVGEGLHELGPDAASTERIPEHATYQLQHAKAPELVPALSPEHARTVRRDDAADRRLAQAVEQHLHAGGVAGRGLVRDTESLHLELRVLPGLPREVRDQRFEHHPEQVAQLVVERVPGHTSAPGHVVDERGLVATLGEGPRASGARARRS